MRKWLPLVAISIGTLMLLVDVTIVNVALPDMATDLGTSFTALQWVIDIYALMLAALLLGVGTIADRLGHRRTYLAGLVLFAAASAASGLAPTPAVLILARAVQGVGAAAMFATTFALLNSAYHGRDRGIAYGIWGSVSGAASAIGPIAGGLLTEHLSWQWIFFVNLPFCLAAIALTVRAIGPDVAHPDARRLDVGGIATFTAFAAGITFALIRANEHGWTDGLVLTLTVLAILALAGFVAIERRSDHPLLDLSLLRHGPFTGALIAGAALTISAFSFLAFVSIWLQSALGLSPVAAGLAGALPMAVSAFVTSAVAGRFLHGDRNWLAVGGGLLLCGLGALVMALQLHSGAGWPALVAGLLVSGVGVGLAAPTLSSTAMSAVPLHRGGMAAGAVNTTRQLGFAVGLAALGSVLAARIAATAADLGVADADRLGSAVAGGGLGQILAGAPAAARPALKSALEAAMIDGLRWTMFIAAAVGIVGGLVAGRLIRQQSSRLLTDPAATPSRVNQ